MHRDETAHGRRATQEPGSFDLIEDSQGAITRRNQEERFAQRARTLLEQRTRGIQQRLTASQVQQSDARTVAPGVVLFHERAPLERREQTVGAALGQAERSPKLADALRTRIGADMYEQVERLVDRCVSDARSQR